MDLVDGEGRDGEGLEGAGVAAMHPLHLVLVHVLQVQHQAPRRARPSKFTLSNRGLYITSKIIFPPLRNHIFCYCLIIHYNDIFFEFFPLTFGHYRVPYHVYMFSPFFSSQNVILYIFVLSLFPPLTNPIVGHKI